MLINLEKRKSNATPSLLAAPSESPAPQMAQNPALKSAVLPEATTDSTVVPHGRVDQSTPAGAPELVAKAATKIRKRTRERKSERMDVRVTPTVKDFVDDVMDASGLTAGDLLLEGARAMLHDLETRIEVEQVPYTRLKIRRRSSEVVPDR
jgi:hypothetical protein